MRAISSFNLHLYYMTAEPSCTWCFLPAVKLGEPAATSLHFQLLQKELQSPLQVYGAYSLHCFVAVAGELCSVQLLSDSQLYHQMTVTTKITKLGESEWMNEWMNERIRKMEINFQRQPSQVYSTFFTLFPESVDTNLKNIKTFVACSRSYIWYECCFC